ncbi:hypothetical protein H1164_12555 [Thermoactinomyces daqus]|uniref:Uncharacterized protein n=1 Tax=Thermoactinomyces daqus TaxID=1329516 RepID=A0A7W2AIF1_9BACL|nr:hypothetical protein [Thermoactinomyces daqus]MBA4543721.1 hypothetical protein [Thermoactinomyces daqus]
MLRFSDILRQHGVKVWLSNLVGSLAVGIVGAFIFVLFFFALMIVGGALLVGSLPSGISLDTMTGDEIIPMLDSFFSSGTLLILLLFLLIGGILYLLLEAFQNAGSISVAVQAVAENKSDISTYFSKGFKYMLKAFLVYLLSSLAYLVPGLLLLIGIIAAGMNSPVIGALLILIGLIGFFILGLAFMHAPYILISEDTDDLITQKILPAFHQSVRPGVWKFLLRHVVDCCNRGCLLTGQLCLRLSRKFGKSGCARCDGADSVPAPDRNHSVHHDDHHFDDRLSIS